MLSYGRLVRKSALSLSKIDSLVSDLSPDDIPFLRMDLMKYSIVARGACLNNELISEYISNYRKSNWMYVIGIAD